MNNKALTLRYNGTIEVLRYIFTLIVCLMHLFYAFWGKGICLGGGYLSVDVFFMISGYFLCSSSIKYGSSYRYTLSRYIGMSFIYILSIILSVLIYGHGDLNTTISGFLEAIPDMLCLQMTGFFYPTINAILWYISAMMMAGFFISYILSNRSSKALFTNLLGPLAILICYGVVYNKTGNLDAVTTDKSEIIPLGLLRAFAGMSIGVLIHEFSNCGKTETLMGKRRLLSTICFYACLLSIISLSIFQHHTHLDFLVLIIAPALLFISFEGDFYGRIYFDKLGNYLILFFGKQYTLTMYCFSVIVYSVAGSFIDFRELGFVKAAILYIIILLPICYLISRLSDKITPKIKKTVYGQKI